MFLIQCQYRMDIWGTPPANDDPEKPVWSNWEFVSTADDLQEAVSLVEEIQGGGELYRIIEVAGYIFPSFNSVKNNNVLTNF